MADRESKRAGLGAGPGDLLVVGVGNLKPQKNAGDFVKIAARVRGRVPRARFVFVGDGPMREALQARAAELGADMLFAGWRRDVAEILSVADAFLLTSLWEGLPRALVEAMKTGLPCASYAVDGVLDVLEDGVNGCTAPPGDWERLAAKVEAMLADEPMRRRLGAKAAASLCDEFDIDVMVRQQERLYEELLSGRSPG